VFLAQAEVKTGRQTQIICSDREGEYDSGEVIAYLQDRGIAHEMTTPATPQHNGVSKHMNRTLLNMVRSMLNDANLPDSFWFEALQYAVHILNTMPTHALDDMMPDKVWSRNIPDVSCFRVFGAQAFVHAPKKNCPKLVKCSLICTFLGFAENCHAYRLYHRQSRHFFESRDVVFNEGGPAPLFKCIVLEPDHMDGGDTNEEGGESDKVSKQPELNDTPPDPGRTKHTIRPPICDDDPRYFVTSHGPCKPQNAQANLADADHISDPRTYAEAMAHPDANNWEAACADEMAVFDHMGVYEVVPHPKDRKVVGSKWVFHIKHGPDGNMQKYKARIVTQGFMQIEGVDYDGTFAPVAKLASLHTILALAAEQDLEIHQMDVKSAYLNGTLSEEIFMEPPLGLAIPNGMVLCLKKAIYGTKQGGQVWYKDISNTLNSMGYQRTDTDHAVFVCNENNTPSIIALYIDDITMVSKDLEVIK
jgi:Reverse transcriptase (RNA-dependent DNA polymerase)